MIGTTELVEWPENQTYVVNPHDWHSYGTYKGVRALLPTSDGKRVIRQATGSIAGHPHKNTRTITRRLKREARNV